MKKSTCLAMLAVVIGAVCALSFAGGDGTNWFNGFDFEKWPLGIMGDVQEADTDVSEYPSLVPVTVRITGSCGSFQVVDSGLSAFGSRSLFQSPGACGLRLFFDPPAKTVNLMYFGTTKKSALYCWQDEASVGDYSITHRRAFGPGQKYLTTGALTGFVACEAFNAYIDEVIARSE